ncbi:ABC transporter permease subunit [Paenibacillus sp. LMG 31458]|uniref:ABC transporter permease subunit n=2 Tax=Paenibacillus TaxID=44249 RepID=A0ABX1Z7S6_9BACL|nr:MULTISPECIES: carbohydrate ABC transporter permease [Paenibacillus]NOU72999.1 ABC transporter permease subunit [Paenibacillus phytorum]NOU88281.1 ABC transporter permease subunit [Paenibacillus germinis]
MNQPKTQWNVIDLAFFFFMLVIAIILLSPVFWLVSASFQGSGEIFKVPFKWIPNHISLDNYINAWNVGKIGEALWNSICVSLLMLVFHVFLCTFSGYVIVKHSFKYKNILIMFILATMMLPQEITFLPIYNVVKSMGLINSYLGLAIPFFYSGFGVFLMMQFARSIPNEIIESAKIDGSSEFSIFLRIVMPMMRSSMAALSILAFSFIWNEFAWSRIAIISDSMRTLPIALSFLAFSSDNSTNITALLPSSVIAIAPVMILFFIFQRQFIESVASSGVKG